MREISQILRRIAQKLCGIAQYFTSAKIENEREKLSSESHKSDESRVLFG